MIIKKPTLILDKNKCLSNIAFMAGKAKEHKLIFRPHFKTHQSAVIGEWFMNYGVDKITVSSVSMAQYFAACGWNDITIAFPVNILEIDEINSLAKKIKINLIADNISIIKSLHSKLTNEVGIFIKIDTGYHRTGIEWDDYQQINEILNFITTSSQLQFKGFLTHSGHSYNAKSVNEIKAIHSDTINKMNSVKNNFSTIFPNLKISIGDTPSCSICDDFNGVDEIRPGNFVFYDVMQYFLGSCASDQIAISVACPVVSVSVSRNEFVIYGGAIHLSKEFIIDKKNNKCFGLVVEFNDNGWSEPIKQTYVSAISQEHGIIKTSAEIIKKIKPGDIVGVLPVHSCLTVHQLKTYSDINGSELSESLRNKEHSSF